MGSRDRSSTLSSESDDEPGFISSALSFLNPFASAPIPIPIQKSAVIEPKFKMTQIVIEPTIQTSNVAPRQCPMDQVSKKVLSFGQVYTSCVCEPAMAFDLSTFDNPFQAKRALFKASLEGASELEKAAVKNLKCRQCNLRGEETIQDPELGSICQKCPLGSYWKAGQCKPCGKGTERSFELTAASKARDFCDCLPGFTLFSHNAGTCDPILKVGKCFETQKSTLFGCKCKATGHFMQEGHCVLRCSPGYQLNEKSLTCQPCPVGSVNPLYGTHACSPCSLGSFSDKSRRRCVQCGFGSISEDSFSLNPSKAMKKNACVCKDRLHKYDSIANECVPTCKPGQELFQKGPRKMCRDCWPGSANSLLNGVCKACLGDSFSFERGRILELILEKTCQACKDGTRSDTLIKQSPKGEKARLQTYFGFLRGGPMCECDPKYFSFQPSISKCNDCPLGQYRPKPNQACKCINKKESLINGACKVPEKKSSCKPGTRFEEFTKSCVQCELGSFSHKYGSDDCKLCDPHTTRVSFDLTTCLCKPGHDLFDPIKGSCNPCQQGKFTSKGKKCGICPNLQFTHETGSEKCQSCGFGTSGSTSDRTGCKCLEDNQEFIPQSRSCRPKTPGSHFDLPTVFNEAYDNGFIGGGDVVAKMGRTSLGLFSLQTLLPGAAIDQPILEFYWNLLKPPKDILMINNFMHTVHHDQKLKESFSNYRVLFLPVNEHRHWFLITVHFDTKHIRMHDSAFGKIHDVSYNLDSGKSAKHLVDTAMDFIQMHIPHTDPKKWTLTKNNPSGYPKQTGLTDGGIYMLLTMKELLGEVHDENQRAFTFHQKMIPYFRRQIAFEILSTYTTKNTCHDGSLAREILDTCPLEIPNSEQGRFPRGIKEVLTHVSDTESVASVSLWDLTVVVSKQDLEKLTSPFEHPSLVIFDYYAGLLMQKYSCFILPTFIMDMLPAHPSLIQTWLKVNKIQLDNTVTVIPISHSTLSGVHWNLATIDMLSRKIQVYDSACETQFIRDAVQKSKVIASLVNQDESVFPHPDWTITCRTFLASSETREEWSGVFTLLAMRALAKSPTMTTMNFEARYLPFYRQKLAHEVMTTQIQAPVRRQSILQSRLSITVPSSRIGFLNSPIRQIPFDFDKTVDTLFTSTSTKSIATIPSISLKLYPGSFKSLKPGQCVESSIVDAYVAMIEEVKAKGRILALPTRFMNGIQSGLDVHEWMIKVNAELSNGQLLIFPIEGNDCHWSFAVVDLSMKSVQLYDSLDRPHSNVFESIKLFLAACAKMPQHGFTFHDSEWEFIQGSFPKQTEPTDSGVFALLGIHEIVFGFIHSTAPVFNFNPETIAFDRRKLAHDIFSFAKTSNLPFGFE